MSQLLALLSAVLFGVGDFAGGVASRLIHVWRVTAWSHVLSLATLAGGLLSHWCHVLLGRVFAARWGGTRTCREAQQSHETTHKGRLDASS